MRRARRCLNTIPSVNRELCRQKGFWSWFGGSGEVGVCVAGKALPDSGCAPHLEDALRALLPAEIESAWLKQIHSASMVAARPGANCSGDALVADARSLALAVVTADCVPILLAVPAGRIAAVHAGWRGLAQRILPATLRRLEADQRPVTAWIGPAIGACCYEVSPEVAEEVQAASDPRQWSCRARRGDLTSISWRRRPCSSENLE